MNHECMMGMGLTILLTAGGCGLPKTHYYTVNAPMAGTASPAMNGKRITVERFHGDSLLRDDRVLFRVNENEVNFYEYQRWASPPVDLVTQQVIQRLNASGIYTSVHSAHDGGPADFVLKGRVLRFEEVDRGKEISAEVAVEVELIDKHKGALLWQGGRECRRAVGEHSVPGVVQGIQQCLDETLSHLLTSMNQNAAKGGGTN